jgi:hypothetical protein
LQCFFIAPQKSGKIACDERGGRRHLVKSKPSEIPNRGDLAAFLLRSAKEMTVYPSPARCTGYESNCFPQFFKKRYTCLI